MNLTAGTATLFQPLFFRKTKKSFLFNENLFSFFVKFFFIWAKAIKHTDQSKAQSLTKIQLTLCYL